MSIYNVQYLTEKELDSLSTKTVADLQGKMAECVEQQRSAQTKVTLIIDGINEVNTLIRGH